MTYLYYQFWRGGVFPWFRTWITLWIICDHHYRYARYTWRIRWFISNWITTIWKLNNNIISYSCYKYMSFIKTISPFYLFQTLSPLFLLTSSSSFSFVPIVICSKARDANIIGFSRAATNSEKQEIININ